jgi:hypothetical protein
MRPGPVSENRIFFGPPGGSRFRSFQASEIRGAYKRMTAPLPALSLRQARDRRDSD